MILKMETFNILLICFIILSLCTESLEILINIMKREAPVQQRLKKTDDILSMLQQERNTCRLVNVLYKDCIERENINEDYMLVDSLGKRMSDRELIDNLFLQNSMLRHSQLVIDWLEKNAADDFSHKYHDKLEYFTENSISWEHTLYKLMTNRAQLDVRPSRKRLIAELHSDAPIRQRNLMLRNMDKISGANISVIASAGTPPYVPSSSANVLPSSVNNSSAPVVISATVESHYTEVPMAVRTQEGTIPFVANVKVIHASTIGTVTALGGSTLQVQHNPQPQQATFQTHEEAFINDFWCKHFSHCFCRYSSICSFIISKCASFICY